MNLPTKHAGTTGETTRGSDETARRPPSVKAALSVSFGQRAPHRASTRDSSPVRRTVPSSTYDRNREDANSRRSPSQRNREDANSRRSPSQSRDLSDREYDRERERERNRARGGERDRDTERDKYRERDRDYDRDRDRRYDHDRFRERSRRDYDRSGHEGGGSRRSRSRSPIRSRSQTMQTGGAHSDYQTSSYANGSREKNLASSNLAKLRDLYGDLSAQKEDGSSKDRVGSRDSGAEEVLRLGGPSWK